MGHGVITLDLSAAGRSAGREEGQGARRRLGEIDDTQTEKGGGARVRGLILCFFLITKNQMVDGPKRSGKGERC